jgi:hypothetical protein
MKTGKWFLWLIAALVSVSLLLAACPAGEEEGEEQDEYTYTQVNAVTTGVTYAINSWYSDTADPPNVCKPNDYLRCEVTGYSTMLDAATEEDMLELRIGARSSENSKWVLEDAGGSQYYFKNVDTGKYLSMEEAFWNVSSENLEWGWNRPLVRDKKTTDDFKWTITANEDKDGFFISSVSQSGKRLNMQTAMEKKGEEWADSSVQCRNLDWGTSQWLFWKVEMK